MHDDKKPQTDEQPPLFTEFTPPTVEEWREMTIASLNGRPIEKLITQTYEGIDLQPIYRRADAEGIAHQYTLPGMAPYVRGADAAGYLASPWLVAQELDRGSPEDANGLLRRELARGQTAINLVFAGADQANARGVTVDSVDDVIALLDGIDLATTPLLAQAGMAALPAAALLIAAARRKGVDVAILAGSLGSDPLGELARGGRLPSPLANAYDEMAALTSWASDNAPKMGTISVDGALYHDGGASAVQELAYCLATSVEYLRAMLARDLDIEAVAPQMRFMLALGGNFFMEVSKLRAARLLWSQIVAAFGGSENAQKMTVHARTSRTNKTVTDPHVNLLRATIETFAGAVGGVASMAVAPFDEVVRTPNEISRRIARNTQLVIQAEANMDRIIDPAGGSWYVEQLTDQLAKGAWSLFQELEAQGGMFAALQAAIPQRQVREVAAKRTANLATRRDVLVGINMYPNLAETALDAGEEAAPQPTSFRQASAQNEAINEAITGALNSLSEAERDGMVEAAVAAAAAGAALGEIARALRRGVVDGPEIEPVPRLRLGAPYESLRAAASAFAQEAGHAPQVFLANMGPLAQHKARADFSAGFLAVGGFECLYPAGFETVEDAAKAALDSGVQTVVICSTDADYPQVVPPLVRQIKDANPQMVVLLAGYPKEYVDAFSNAGVDEFIHVRADCYAINRMLQERNGITDR